MQKILYVNPAKKEISDSTIYSTVTAALESIPADNTFPTLIRIAPGHYHEKITIDKPFLTLEGEGPSNDETVLTYDDYANFIMEDGFKRGTFRSYSVFIDSHDITLKNLTIENASGDSNTHGQAIALYADGDRIILDHCRLLGHQDTLFTAPLPPKEVEPRGFIGPKQFAPRLSGRHYYKDCYICGDVDFIFGGGTAYFENCVIESLSRGDDKEIQGYVTAASTPEGQEYGYVFAHCKLISKDCPKESVYLGRPWREYAKTVFIHCDFGPHIHREGFHDWNKTAARETIFYGEYECVEDVSKRAPYVKQLSADMLASYTKIRNLRNVYHIIFLRQTFHKIAKIFFYSCIFISCISQITLRLHCFHINYKAEPLICYRL